MVSDPDFAPEPNQGESVIVSGKKDRLAIHPTLNHMLRYTGDMDAGTARHGAN